MFRNLALAILILGFLNVVAGTFVRLSDAGLSCPDWPGCYGQFGMPDVRVFTDQSGQAHGGIVPDLGKARISMTHRYLSGLIGGLILILWGASFFVRVHRRAAIQLATLLATSFLVQAAIGMGVVRLKLMPVAVLAHLLSGLLVLSIAFWTYLRINPRVRFVESPAVIRLWVRFSLLILVLELMLGSWTSANYAALACPDFPTCLGSWWPPADYLRIFSVFQGTEMDYRGGVLGHDARIAINWFHRLGAFVVFVVLGGLALSLSSSNYPPRLRKAGVVLSGLLMIQIALGIAMVIFRMPIPIAVAHSAGAALLLLILIYINFWTTREVEVVEALVAKPGVAAQAAVVAPEVIPVPEKVPELVPEAEVEVEPVRLFQRLSTQLKKTRSGLTDIFASLPVGKKEIDRDLVEDIEATLILADIGVEATREIIDNLSQGVQRKQLSDAAALRRVLRENLLAILKPCDRPLSIESRDKPFVILVVGVNGVGKTTTIGKLAKRFQSNGLSVMLAAGDTFRAAAIEQLQTWGERNQVPVVAQHTGADSASVVYDALQSAQARGIDVLIADTAGRLHTKENLMEELRKVKRIMAKLDPDAPHEVLLVLDAGTGQNALSQAEQFNQIIGLTGIALTKLDGTAKGGVIFALAKRLGIPIRYIGIGEGINDLQDFHAAQFIEALFADDSQN